MSATRQCTAETGGQESAWLPPTKLLDGHRIAVGGAIAGRCRRHMPRRANKLVGVFSRILAEKMYGQRAKAAGKKPSQGRGPRRCVRTSPIDACPPAEGRVACPGTSATHFSSSSSCFPLNSVRLRRPSRRLEGLLEEISGNGGSAGAAAAYTTFQTECELGASSDEGTCLSADFDGERQRTDLQSDFAITEIVIAAC